MPNMNDLVVQLNALLRLTNTEIMIAETRRGQATRPDIERELATNADKGRERARMLARAIRDVDGIPDVVGVAVGRFAATAKAAGEQGQDFVDALLGDLALEHELADRTRFALMLTAHLDARPVVKTLERLERAHAETITWLNVRLGEVAAGGPAALRPTTMQTMFGVGRRLSALPVRNSSQAVNRSIDGAGRIRRQTVVAVQTNTQRVRELVDAAGQIWTAGRDASLKRSEQIADERGDKDQARVVNRRRRELGAVDAGELPIRGYDALRADVANTRIGRLTDTDDVRTMLAYETAHKARKSVITTAQRRLEQLAADLSAAS